MSTRTASKKVLQSFQVRDGLWEAFVSKAGQMDCSVDYLINEAMRSYAENHNFLALVPESAPEPIMDLDDDIEEVSTLIDDIEDVDESSSPSVLPPVEDDDVNELSKIVEEEPLLAVDDDLSGDLPILKDEDSDELPALDEDDDDLAGLDLGNGPGAPAVPLPQQTAPTLAKERSQKAPVPVPPKVVNVPIPPKAVRTPHVTTGTAPSVQKPAAVKTDAVEPARPMLSMVYEGRKILVKKDQFIIGRGSKSADLPVKDPNVSRKHAAIIFHNGAYYIKDLGSTNGVEFAGRLVDSKRIDEGDQFTICGHQLKFTYV